MITVESHSPVLVVRWAAEPNLFGPESTKRWHEVLDELEAGEGDEPVVVCGAGRNFSQGLDLAGFGEHPETMEPTVAEVHRLLGRMLLLDRYVVGALVGHAFGAGAMLAATFDATVMRSDRGYWCLPEADLGIPLTDAMFAALSARLPRRSLIEAMNTAHRYDAAAAVAAGIVDEAVAEHEVLPRAIERAASMAGRSRRVLRIHKRQLFAEAAAVCGA